MSARTATSTAECWFPTAFKPIAPLVAAVVGLLMLAGIAIAQDPPTRVGRLSDVGGQVFLASDDSEAGWQPVSINYPITIGDNIWVSPEGRAEVDYGGGQLRLAQEANVHFSQLDERVFSAFLANGRASLHLRTIDPGETAKLDTPNAQIDLLRPGTYRLDTSAEANHTTLVVRDGEAEMRVGDRMVIVLAGQSASVQGNGYGAAMSVRDGIGIDGFDQYAIDRDRRIESAGPAEQYVSTAVPGVSDLDAYGTWDTVPTYGAVWYPSSVSPNWVPYQDGSWTYVQPWGWTWVDNAPWGWVPFHYGRWVRIGPRWAWTPGEYVRRPVYAPALVAWFGGASGTGWSVGSGRPTFGWVPLSWGEPYWPHYRYSTEYWRRQNQSVAVDVRRVPPRAPQRFNYANARVPGAVAAASAEVLANRRPVGPNHYVVSPQQIASAPLTTSPLSVRPVARPNVIDKMPPRAPEPAGAFAARVRPDLRTPSIGGARGPEPMGIPGRPGIGGTPYSGQPTPATPLPVPGAIQPIPQQGSVQPLPQPGSIQPMPRPDSRPGMGQPNVNDPRSVGGQMYVPNNRAQPTPGSTQPPTVNRPSAPQVYTPQPIPVAPSAQPSIQPLPQPAPSSVTQSVPTPPMRQRPQPGAVREVPPVVPHPAPQPAPVQVAPSPQPAFVPQQRMIPMQRAPAPMPTIPVAPAPSSIAPAPAPITPAPASIAPAPNTVAVPPGQPHPGQQHPQGVRPAEVVPVQPQPIR